MSTPTTDITAKVELTEWTAQIIEETVATHQYGGTTGSQNKKWKCRCGWKYGKGEHPAHVTAAIMAALNTAPVVQTEPTDPKALADLRETIFRDAGLEPRFYLAGHPAWPDALTIWPPTEENAAEYHQKYVVEDDREKAANAKIIVRWVQEGSQTWTPEAVTNHG